MSREEKPTEGRIAIQDGKLAIFGSTMGFAGPVIQQYEPFTDKEQAVADARKKIADLGLPLHEEISYPFISRMVMTTSKPRRRRVRS